MHRTTVSFGDEDWRKLRRIALGRKMSLSRLIALAADRIKSEKVKPRDWKFTWQPRPMGKPNADFRTREGIYEFLSD